jgi:hypothetical protein
VTNRTDHQKTDAHRPGSDDECAPTTRAARQLDQPSAYMQTSEETDTRNWQEDYDCQDPRIRRNEDCKGQRISVRTQRLSPKESAGADDQRPQLLRRYRRIARRLQATNQRKRTEVPCLLFFLCTERLFRRRQIIAHSSKPMVERLDIRLVR